MADPTIRVVDALTGQTWDYTDRGACPTLEKLVTGDGSITWSIDFTQFVDTLPPDHSRVYVEDPDGEIQRGRLVSASPPDTSLCTGPCQFVAEGDSARLRDQKFDDDVKFGPVFDGTSLGLTPEAAVEYAISQNVPLVSVTPITPTGFTLPDTESFLGRTAHDVVNTMTAVSAGLATPYIPSVRKGIFRYAPLDLSPRYEVTCANGAIVTPRRDASRLYNRVIVIWGNDQVITYPSTISYGRLPTAVDLVVNAGTEIHTALAALRLAEGLYAKLQTLELGWSWTVTIPADAQIQRLFPGDSGPTAHNRMNAGYFLRVPDLDPTGRYGPHHPSPDHLLMTHIRTGGESGETLVTCGEMRDPAERMIATVRDVMYRANSRVVHALQTPGLNIATRDADKLNVIGQQSATAASDLTSSGGLPAPQPIRPGVPQQSVKDNTIHPTALPPQEVVQQFHDAEPTTSGIKMKVVVPPEKALSWTMMTSGIVSDYAATWTRRSNGAVIATMDLAGSSEKIDQPIGGTGTAWDGSSDGLVNTDDVLIYTVTTPASSTAVEFIDSGVRFVRHYTNYPGNASPRTGVLAP